MKKKIRVIVPVIVLIGLVCFLVMHYAIGPEPTEYEGTIEATEYTLGSPLGGIIKEIKVDEGDQVTPGAILAVVKHDDLLADQAALRSALAAAESQLQEGQIKLANSTRNFERLKGLKKAGSVTAQSIDDTEAAMREAKAMVDAAGAQVQRIGHQIDSTSEKIAYATVLSPIQGTVIGRYFEPGEMVSPAGGIIKIADLNKLWLKVYVPLTQLGAIGPGQTAEVKIDGSAQKFTGKVSWISEVAEFTPKNVQTKEERVKQVYAVKVLIDNPQGIMKIGMPADVRFGAKKG